MKGNLNQSYAYDKEGCSLVESYMTKLGRDNLKEVLK